MFSLDTSPDCKKAKAVLKQKGADFEEISITTKPEWRQYMYLLANGKHGTQNNSLLAIHVCGI